MDGCPFSIPVTLVLLLFMIVMNSRGCPGGAPANHKVCKHLHPHHNDTKAQKIPSPYSIILEKNKIASGTPVQVRITARPGFTYQGFIMQARSGTGRPKPIGTFRVVDVSHSKTIDCFHIPNNTVTHSSSAVKNTTNFVWTPPAKYKGSVTFQATVVQNYSTFWEKVTAHIVVDSDDQSNDEDIEGLTPIIFPSRDIFDSESRQLNRIYEECGVTKTCFGVPDDCIFTKSCYALVTVVARESKYEFEMTGVGYVAVSLSEDGHFNEASATECILVDNAVVRLFQSRLYEYDNEYSNTPTYNGLELINSSYWNGMVYCKFVRDEVIELNGVQFNLRNKKYSILLASEKTKNKSSLDTVKFHSSKKNYLSNVSGFCTPQLGNNWKIRLAYGILIFDLILGVLFSVYFVI